MKFSEEVRPKDLLKYFQKIIYSFSPIRVDMRFEGLLLKFGLEDKEILLMISFPPIYRSSL